MPMNWRRFMPNPALKHDIRIGSKQDSGRASQHFGLRLPKWVILACKPSKCVPVIGPLLIRSVTYLWCH
jgi:hypothetical protein